MITLQKGMKSCTYSLGDLELTLSVLLQVSSEGCKLQ